MFAPMVSENRNASSKTTPTVRRRSASEQVADVGAAERDAPGLPFVEPGQQQRDGRLSGPGCTDQRHGRAGRDVQVEAVEHRFVVGVAEAHADRAGRRADRLGSAARCPLGGSMIAARESMISRTRSTEARAC